MDRIGQASMVQVFNFWVQGTVEERVLDVLERRINVFEETVGGLDPILGDAERDLAKIFQLGGEERERALRQFEERIEARLQEARAAEEKLRDFIMETKSYSREIAAQVAGDVSTDQPGRHGTVRQRLSSRTCTRTCTGSGRRYVRDHVPRAIPKRLPRAHSKDRPRRRTVAFRPDVQPDSEHVEYLALGHPVVDELVRDVTAPAYAGRPQRSRWNRPRNSHPASGWLIVHEIGVPGLKEVRELAPVFVHDDGRVDPDLGQAPDGQGGRFPERPVARPG